MHTGRKPSDERGRMSRLSRACGRLLGALLIACFVACVDPDTPASEASPEAPVRSLIGSTLDAPGQVDSTTDDDLGADDLEGLGELGVLPNLVQRALAPSAADCDFDSALSTCQ